MNGKRSYLNLTIRKTEWRTYLKRVLKNVDTSEMSGVVSPVPNPGISLGGVPLPWMTPRGRQFKFLVDVSDIRHHLGTLYKEGQWVTVRFISVWDGAAYQPYLSIGDTVIHLVWDGEGAFYDK